jgi:Sulfotransferase family
MQPTAPCPERLLIVGLPRSGTTLLATLLGAQPGIQFLTDYFPAFTDLRLRLAKPWNGPLSQSERRIALALVRDQFLRVRHPVLVKLDGFSTIDELHRSVLAELSSDKDRWVGHKLLMDAATLSATLAETNLRCLLLVRDPRDAALSYFHRTGTGVERYVRNWMETVRVCRQLEGHPQLLALRYEDLITSPAPTLNRLGQWLGLELDSEVPALQFRRSRAHGGTGWQENSAFQDVKRRYDPQPLERWRSQPDSPIVRYAGWAARTELGRMGYAGAASVGARERWRFACLRALEVGERRAYAQLQLSSQWLRRRLTLEKSPWAR